MVIYILLVTTVWQDPTTNALSQFSPLLLREVEWTPTPRATAKNQLRMVNHRQKYDVRDFPLSSDESMNTRYQANYPKR